ncbi:MarR family winged helix-turn-helix transcriptional regulator [Nocardioides sp.]|uniref:MarR family winged helix-turn-helix transcriptional regulator n=1 Tax=Nocardioides sp. TaxID=35761 RepID=UPI00378517BF
MQAKATSEEVVTSLLTASRVLVGVAARSLAEVESDVTVTQFRTLVVLAAHGPVKQGAVAAHLGVNASTALRMIDRLEHAGLVERRPNPRSRRELLVSLSDAGRLVVDRVTDRRRRELQTIVRRLAPQRRAAVVEALRDFAAAAGEPEPVAGTLWGWSLVGE